MNDNVRDPRHRRLFLAALLAATAARTGQARADDLLKLVLPRAAARGVASAGIGPRIPEQGGLLSFTQTYSDQYGRIAALLDKVLRGANPAEIPFELPDRANLVVNAGVAKAIGLPLPQALLLRATRVIG